MSQNDNDHDVRDESMRKTTRRGLLGALGVAGLASLGSSGASANLGGGPEAGAMTDYQVPYFRVPESDLDTPGVVGRRVEITTGGSSYETGDQLVDTGTSWERVSAGYDSVSTDEFNNTVHLLTADGGDLKSALSDHGSNTKYVVHDPGEPIVFNAEDSIHSLPDHIKIEGADWPTCKLGDGADDDIIRTAVDGSGDTTVNVTIEGIHFDGNKQNQSSGVASEDPSGSSPQKLKGLVGVRLVDTDHCTVRDCTFIDFARFGVQTKLSTHWVVEGGYSHNCADDGYTTSNQYYDTQTEMHGVFRDLYATDNADQGIEVEDGACNVLVENCWLEGNGKEQGTVKSHPGEAACEDIIWRDTTFVSTDGTMCAKVYSAAKGDPRGRTFDDCTFFMRGSSTVKGIQLGMNNSTSNLPLHDVTLRDCRIVVEGSVTDNVFPILHNGHVELHNLSLDVTVEDNSGGVGHSGFYSKGSLYNPTITVDHHGNGNTDVGGIVLKTVNGETADVTITEDTHVEGCKGAGAIIGVDGNPMRNGTVSGTYKNNGQDTNKNSALRVGVAFWQYSGIQGPTDFNVTDVRAYDDQGTQTQIAGVYHHPDAQYLLFDGCNLRGNANAAFTGTAGTGVVKGDNIT